MMPQVGCSVELLEDVGHAAGCGLSSFGDEEAHSNLFVYTSSGGEVHFFQFRMPPKHCN